MRFFSKQILVLAALTCSVLASGVPASTQNGQDVGVPSASTNQDSGVGSIDESRVHTRDFSTLVSRDKSGECDKALDKCLASVAKNIKGGKKKQPAIANCYATWRSCREKAGNPAPEPETEDCEICLGDIVIGESDIKTLSCGHYFDWSCVNQWLQTSNKCPKCRRTVQK